MNKKRYKYRYVDGVLATRVQRKTKLKQYLTTSGKWRTDRSKLKPDEIRAELPYIHEESVLEHLKYWCIITKAEKALIDMKLLLLKS